MSETPAWLEATNNDPPAAAAHDDGDPSNAASSLTTTTSGTPNNNNNNSALEPSSISSEVDEKDLPTIIFYMRLVNMAAAVALITISILLMTSMPSLAAFVLAIYATFGIWRFIFYMVIASVSWSYDTVPGKIVAGVWAGIAIFNTYVLCRYPAYRRIREKIAKEEDKRIEARISKEVKRQAVNQAAVKN
eukprot:scaffold4973_cov135-Cylindrotheca_fusiformis.AAC.23